MRIQRILIPFVFVAYASIVAGCATLSESDCRAAQWSDIGFRDGRSGRPEDRIAEHTKACAKYEIAPDRVAYFEGREAGLQQYCTRRSGFQVGRYGGSYENVCSREEEREFLAGFGLGHSIYEAHGRLDDVDAQISRLEKQLESEELSDDARKALTRERIALEGERGGAEERLRRLEWEARSM
jgi:hypothetical protein